MQYECRDYPRIVSYRLSCHAHHDHVHMFFFLVLPGSRYERNSPGSLTIAKQIMRIRMDMMVIYMRMLRTPLKMFQLVLQSYNMVGSDLMLMILIR